MTTAQAEAADFSPFDFVYVGRRALQGGKPGGEIRKIVDGQLTDAYVFAAASLKGRVIGCIYRGAHFSSSQARGLAAAEFVGRWEDQGDLIDWKARDQAFETEQRRFKMEADAKKVNEIEAIMLPLRKLYASYSRKYDHAGKEALEQAVLRALRAQPRATE